MPRLQLVIRMVVCVALVLPALPAQAELRSEVESLIEASGAEVAVAMRTLDGDSELLIAEDLVLHAASTMKIPVMMELLKRHDARDLSLDETMEIGVTFKSIVDGSPYQLTVDSDSDGQVYSLVGTRASLRLLNEAMITRSSNLATNLLIERLGAENIRATVSSHGADGMTVLRGVEDLKAFEAGQSNSTTAEALLTLLEAIAKGEAASPASTRLMIDVLSRQQFRDGIPAGLPPNARVAHKTGSITKIHHDAALVLAERPYVLVILTRGLGETEQSATLMAGIARLVHAHTQAP